MFSLIKTVNVNLRRGFVFPSYIMPVALICTAVWVSLCGLQALLSCANGECF